MGVIRIWAVDVSVRWMKAPTGASKRGKEKSKVTRKRGEYVVKEAKRVKGFHLRTGTHC